MTEIRSLRKRSKATKFVLFLGGCLHFVLPAKSQEALTLQQAISISLEKSYNIQISKNDLYIDRINNNIGVAGALPTVTGSVNVTESVNSLNQKLSNGNNTNRNNTASNAASGGITGSILLYNGLRVYATKSRLNELEKQSTQLLNA